MATKIKLIADNAITTTQIDTSSLDSHFSGGTGVTYSSGEISIGQAVHSTDSPTFADLTLTGNLNITGDLNSYNVTDLDVTDQTITLGAGQTEALSGGSGIIVDGSNASILWDETNDQFDINKGLNVDSDTFVVDNTNNRVGIGTSSPSHLLEISGTTPTFRIDNTGGVNNYLDINYGSKNTNDISFTSRRGGSPSGFVFGTEPGGSYSALMKITSGGNVGIGTDNPAEKLHIAASSYTAPTGGLDDNINLLINNSQYCGIQILGSSTGSSFIHFGDQDNADVGLITYEHNSDYMRFDVNATERMRIDSDGNVGIGDVPTSTATGSMSPRLFVDNNLGDGTLGLQIASYHPSIVLSDKSAGLHNYIISHDGGHFSIGYEGGTAGSSNSFTSRLKILSSGNVGIGTSSPDAKLEVAGASGSSSSFKLSGRPDWTSGNGEYNVGNIYGENLGAGVNTTRIKLDGDDTSGTMLFYTAASGTLQPALVLDNTQNATFYGSTTIPLGDRYYGQIKARDDMYVTSYGGGAGSVNEGLLVSGGNTNENSWVFIDSANPGWGIYHRNTDSTETYSSDEPLRPNSWAWVGQGRLSGYITLENKIGGVTTQASYVRGGLAGVYHDYKFKSDSGFEIGKGDDGEPVHTPTINERSSATNAVNSTVGNGGPGVYWLNFNSKRFRAYVRPNWLQGRNWVLAAKWFSATDMPSGSAYWSNDDYHNEGDFNPYSGLWSKYLSWRYFSFNRLAMQMGDRIAPIMQFSSSQTLYGAFSGGRASNGGGVSPTSTDPALSTGATYHGMTNYMGPNFTDLAGSEDKMQSYGLNKWANASTNSTSANNNGSADLNSNVSQGFQLTVEDAHKNIGGIPSQGVAGAWIGCPLDEGNCNPLSTSSNGAADSGFGFGTGAGNSARTSTSGIIEWAQGNRVANYFPAYVWLSID